MASHKAVSRAIHRALFFALFLPALLSMSSHASYYTSTSSHFNSFVSTQGYQFVVNQRPVYFNGFNAYYLTYLATDSPDQAAQILQQAAATGLTLCRTWGFNDGTYHALQVSPGVYDEASFKALDFVLNEANNNGIRVILSFANNYANMGGKAQYVQWARNAGVGVASEDDFFTNPTVKSYYKNYIQYVVTRVNTLTGVAYKDDPTIFAWELMNEPRCPSDPSGDTLYEWIEEMSSYVKSLDANHMVEAGLEGFYGAWSEDKQHLNPSGMGLFTGTDYIRFSQISTIDFTSVHSYPDIWLSGSSFAEQLAFFTAWISSHVSDGFSIKKPVLFAEFGLSRDNPGSYSDENRNTLFSAMYSTIYTSATTGGPGGGALLWQICSQGLENSVATDGYGVVLSTDSPTTFLISLQSQKLTALNQ